jgi:RNA polymerase sigma-70 factor (ECF subfamily)
MSPEPLDALLDRLCAGDPQAAEQVFVTYEPFLRLVVRRHLPERLRTKLDSADVVQSVWADVVQGFRTAGWRFPTAGHLRAFLVKATRNRLHDALRRHHTALEREQPLPEGGGAPGPAARQPRPSEVAQAEDVWDKLLALCPPDHHDVLRLRREGLQLAEIAERTGLHEGSVRRILRKLARQLACDEPEGERPKAEGGRQEEESEGGF